MNFIYFDFGGLLNIGGVPTLMHGFYSQFIAGLLITITVISLFQLFIFKSSVDSALYWFFAFVLTLFTALRPIGLTNDDVYYKLMVNNIPKFSEYIYTHGSDRDYVWYLCISILKEILNGTQAFAILCAIGVFIKLYVIERLCVSKLLALLLYIPLVYIQYDFTMVRGGLALSWFFVGLFFLCQRRLKTAYILLLTNWFVHVQAILSSFVLSYKMCSMPWVFPLTAFLILFMLNIGLYPNHSSMFYLSHFSSTDTYYKLSLTAYALSQSSFAIAYYLLVIYGIFVCWQLNNSTLCQITSASILLALVMAWLFVTVPAIQQRLIEFYLAPIVFLAGNLTGGRIMKFATIILSLALFVRLEILHDWILG